MKGGGHVIPSRTVAPIGQQEIVDDPLLLLQVERYDPGHLEDSKIQA